MQNGFNQGKMSVGATGSAYREAGQSRPTSKLGDRLSNEDYDLVCLSHLRWDFVYQRPQHLLSRCASERRVFFIEEPIFDAESPRLDSIQGTDNLTVIVPHLPAGLDEEAVDLALQKLVDTLFMEHAISEYVLWYYTPMATTWTSHLEPLVVVYDCMDELSAFRDAPRRMKQQEAELFDRANLVFTGGQSLYEAKRDQHPHVYAFPSSIDAAHFAHAREIKEDPVDQAKIPFPRLGFFGVIDERLDVELIVGVAEARPDWHIVMIGPVVKIDPASLPRSSNIHYLGSKSYAELPSYIARWDVALLPFALNESTRFISPTKTPEYLAAGRPVVSTSIRDVVRPYGQQRLVRIADTVTDFVAAVEAAMTEEDEGRIRRVDSFLAQNSWDRTWARMRQLIENVIGATSISVPLAQAITSKRPAAGATGTLVAD
ncbi:MAG: glycosyltransferase family 1 protein [Pyrinomonadaceae bacterium]|nr:glycosyltransferase family 1 protein [Pyrinomonadaceae bacterium]